MFPLCCIFVEITANFDKRIYRVQEHQGSVSPKIVLTEPSPCCFILHAQLSDVTARGGLLYTHICTFHGLFLHKYHKYKVQKDILVNRIVQ